MCTASWLRRDGGYEIFFNRDESRLRARAEPPARRTADGTAEGVSILAPRDPDGGGTWIAANEHGVTVALLNRYREASLRPVPENRRRSRGLLVLDLAASPGVEAVEAELHAQELDRYPAFTVLAATPFDTVAGGVRTFTWNGEELRGPETPRPPLSSSGFDAAGAAAARESLWQELRDRGDAESREDILALHRSHYPSKGALSPCMHRFEARTVSLIHVAVTEDRIAMAYADGSPCRTPLGEPVILERR